MRPAAKLLRERAVGNRDHAHLIAVLFTEKRHGARLDSFFELRDLRVNLFVPENVLVHQVFDIEQVLLRKRRVVREVEAQAVGRDERSGLLGVRPDHFVQRRVEQVRARVIAANCVAPLCVHDGGHGVAHVQRLASHRPVRD